MIFSVAVSPAFQGKKLGIRLLDFADEQTRLWGLPEVRLYTNSRMERNIALYATHGFPGKRVDGPIPTGQDGPLSTWPSPSTARRSGLIFRSALGGQT